MWRSIPDIEQDVRTWQGRLEGLIEARLAVLRVCREQNLSDEIRLAFESRLIHHEIKCGEVHNDRNLELAQARERAYRAEHSLVRS